MKQHYQRLATAGPSSTVDGRVQAKHGARPFSRTESGVALVITLILLSIITFMAITLLVVTRNEKGSVETTADQNTATLMNDAAVEHFKMMFIAPMIAFTNPFTSDFLVSTNFINPGGFLNASPAVRNSFTNVNYQYATTGNSVNGGDFLQLMQNLFYHPRVPVYITNRAYGSNEFRYYLDINRNRVFDETGLIPVIGTNGPLLATNGMVLSNYYTGDPQWIGVLEKPGFPHSATNRAVGRYAFFAIPISQTLDLNYMHNYSKTIAVSMPQGSDSFFRNMGVGNWEMNLAAFLVDLNTNIWQPIANPYRYYALGNYLQPNTGLAFEDALSLLRYRYASNWRLNLFSVAQMFGPRGIAAFSNDGIDGYTHGVAMTGTSWTERDANLVNVGWPGSDGTNYFFTTQDLFDRNKTGMNVPVGTLSFSDRLIASTTSSNTYDRTTYFRLLSQLATDSAPERDRINLNYRNVDDNGIVVPNAATNFIPWVPSQFFTNVAVRLLLNAGYAVGPFGSTTNLLVVDNQGRTNLHIPIWPTNYYTPSVHRLLQLAANIYDATTNRSFGAANATNGFPTVFRPVFEPLGGKAGGHIFIKDYEEVQDASLVTAPPAMRDLNDPVSRNSLRTKEMVYGIPLIVGAKKGFPNFNEFSMETAVSVTRKMQFVAPVPRNPRQTRPIQTNHMYVVSISNVFGIEGWNSYSNSYPRSLQIIVGCDMTAVVTNELGRVLVTNRFLLGTNQPVATWEGFKSINQANNSFKVPFPPNTSHFHFLTNSTYSFVGDRFTPLTSLFEANQFALPHWWLQLNTRLRFILVDTGVNPNRIIDYVNLASSDLPIDITHELMKGADCTATYNPGTGTVQDGLFWCTNRAAPLGLTHGSRLQIDVSAGLFDADWKQSQSIFPGSGLSDRNAAIDFFRSNFFGLPAKYGSHGIFLTNIFYSPFNPSRTLYITTSWQANDPLVHYTVGDLQDVLDLQGTNRVQTDRTFSNAKISNVGRLNDRYEPWQVNPANSSSKTVFELGVKDPMVTRSDDWDFPTNKLPNIGSLGRVHRGTPWQTMYLKSGRPLDITNWAKWTGNIQTITNYGQIDTNILNLPVTVSYPATNWTYDLLLTYPTNDWSIFELFTTAFNDNASRGRLSVNQTNLAAWSALLSGIVALEADPKGSMMSKAITNRPVVIEPVGTADSASPLWQLWSAINRVRSSTNFNGAFKKVGDILAVPEFSVESPFLNMASVTDTNWSRNDAACERLPQQVMSLLTLDRAPRYLIYSWGQALKPANKSIITSSGAAFGLCTNYQITAETATRTIVRLEGLPNNPHMVVEKFNVLPPD